MVVRNFIGAIDALTEPLLCLFIHVHPSSSGSTIFVVGILSSVVDMIFPVQTILQVCLASLPKDVVAFLLECRVNPVSQSQRVRCS